MATEKELEDAKSDILILRRLLWFRHNIDHAATLYGDDGEMQCGICLIDFKRDPVSKIEWRFQEQGLRAIADIKK